VNDPDQSLVWSNGTAEDLPERLWRYDDDPAAAQERPVTEPGETFVNLGFIGAALKRKAWLWCSIALAGLLIGAGIMVKFPPSYQASTTVLVKDNPADLDPNDTMTTNATLAQSNRVATQVVRQLGLRQSAASLIATATITPVTSQIVTIAVTAPTSADAVSRASAWATAFLQFRADYLRSQQQLLASQADQQVKQAQQRLASIGGQITEVSAQPASSAQKAKLTNLDAQSQAQSGIITTALGNSASAQTTTTTMVDGSEVLNPAVAAPHGHSKEALLYVGGGLIAGLAVGMGIVIIGAITSDRLRRRDDVAGAIGAPVRLSVRRAKRDGDTRRVVTHLRSVTPVHSHATAGLAVVAVDNAPLVAPIVVALAVSWAREGKKVVLADLADGVLAKCLGARTPGVTTVSVQGEQLAAVVPARDDIAPIGPAYRRTESLRPSEELLAACASADLLLTLTTLDPAFGGEHLVTWATDAVAMVSAGRSSAARIHAVGEMIKLAGTRLVSVVLLGADKDDESLGTSPRPDSPASLGIL
jgi:capsular polysaccharide biosynthesis protein